MRETYKLIFVKVTLSLFHTVALNVSHQCSSNLMPSMKKLLSL